MQQTLSKYAVYKKYATAISWSRQSLHEPASKQGSGAYEEVSLYALTYQPESPNITWDFKISGYINSTNVALSPYYTTLTLYGNAQTVTAWPASNWHTANSFDVSTYNGTSEYACSNSFSSLRMRHAKYFAVRVSVLPLSTAYTWISTCHPTFIYYSTAAL